MTDTPLPYDEQEASLSPRDHGEYIIKRLENYAITYTCGIDQQLVFHFKAVDLLNFVTFLYEDTHCAYDQLTDIFCIDYPGREERFRLIYTLVSLKYRRRIALSCWCHDRFISLSSIFSAATIYERDIWDLFGIQFHNHSDHRRLYHPLSYSVFPLRKDFPFVKGVHAP